MYKRGLPSAERVNNGSRATTFHFESGVIFPADRQTVIENPNEIYFETRQEIVTSKELQRLKSAKKVRENTLKREKTSDAVATTTNSHRTIYRI